MTESRARYTSEEAVNMVENRFDLVLIASQRVRELKRGHRSTLNTKATKAYEYSLLKLKYIGRGDAKTAIKEIGIDAVTKNRVPGLLQFIPRYNTIIKVGSY